MRPDDQIRVISALDSLITDLRGLDVKPLQGRPEFCSRLGKYRILFVEGAENKLYVITTIGSRGNIYTWRGTIAPSIRAALSLSSV